MKLLMITGDRGLAEGKHGAFFNTLEEFHKYWDRIDIICPRVTTGNREREKNFFGNVFLHSSPWSLIFQPFWIWKKGRAIFRKEKFNLVTVHDFPPFYNGIGARLLWRKIKVFYILEIHHVPGHPRTGSAKEVIYKWLLELFIRFDASRAKAIRVVNQKETPEFLVKHGIPKTKLIYIPSVYLDLDIFKPMSVEKKYDLVFAARLEKNKGIFDLLEAIKIAKRDKPDISLLIIGSGREAENLKLKIKDLGIGTNVTFSGWLEGPQDVATAYNSAKVFINPSYNEGGPRVVLEAMACGLPVITTPVGLMHDIIQDGQNGLITDWEPTKMAEKILMLLSDQEMQKRFSTAGLELVKNYDKKSAIQNYAEKLKLFI